MLNKIKNLKSREEGFTIIEVMIVLVIAGLILVIVFLAVPALQRNSRNTQRKNDVSRVGSAVQTVEDNNNGSFGTLTAAQIQTAIQNELGNLSYYTNSNVTYQGNAPAAGVNDTTVDNVKIYLDGTCSNGQATSTGATTRGVAIVYSTEQGGGGVNHLCITQ